MHADLTFLSNVIKGVFSTNKHFMSLVLNTLDISSKQIRFALLLCIYQYVSAVNVIPTLSIADVKMQKTQRTDDSDGCHKPHDYYKR